MEDMPQDRTLWKNNTKAIDPEGTGWTIGVSVYDRDNHETSRPLMSGETVWLTIDERVLTANAPREEADNPFTNGHLVQVEEEARPIGRSIGGESKLGPDAATAAAPEAPEPDPTPEPEAPAAPAPPPAAARTIGGGETAPLPPELRLGGDDDVGAGEAPAVSGPVTVVPDGGVREVQEEHAVVAGDAVVAEETGAAVPPAGEPPVGEFAQHEEVGTPEAPAAAEERPAPSPDAFDQEAGLHALTPASEPAPPTASGSGRFRNK